MNLTKDYLDKALEKQTRALMAYTDDRIEALARIVQAGFEDLQERLNVTDRIEKLEKDMKKIKDSLHVR